jgi:hypothetical protein
MGRCLKGGKYDNSMEMNEPITVDGELHFCEEGNRLAHRFLDASLTRCGIHIPNHIVTRKHGWIWRCLPTRACRQLRSLQ